MYWMYFTRIASHVESILNPVVPYITYIVFCYIEKVTSDLLQVSWFICQDAVQLFRGLNRSQYFTGTDTKAKTTQRLGYILILFP